MTNQNHEQEVPQAEQKRARRTPIKVRKTAAEIVEELGKLHHELNEMEKGLEEIPPNSAFHAVAEKLLNEKKAEFDAARNAEWGR